MQKIIYFDNAATTWPKPSTVIQAVADAMQYYGGNPGRGTHRLARAADELLFDCRQTASELFNVSPENVVFTLNATHALNLAIKGLSYSGCHILIDNFAHNAAYRPVMSLRNRGCTVEIYDASGDDEEITANIHSRFRQNTGLVIATHQSNVCSKVLPVERIGAMCRKHRVPFIIDASQSAGNLQIDLEKTGASAICMPGHKGLFGPMGCGMLLCSPDARFSTIIEGGAGINSKDTVMPDELPERLEAGTVALPAIAGLKAGMDWVGRIGIENIRSHEEMLAGLFVREAVKIPRVMIYGQTNGSVISMNIEGFLPSEVCEKLNSRGICVRAGYHCAPLAHKTLGTEENGTVRLSFSCRNHTSEINTLLDVLSRDFS